MQGLEVYLKGEELALLICLIRQASLFPEVSILLLLLGQSARKLGCSLRLL